MVFLLSTMVVPDEAVYSPELCSPHPPLLHCSFMSPALPLEAFVTPALKVPGGLEASGIAEWCQENAEGNN